MFGCLTNRVVWVSFLLNVILGCWIVYFTSKAASHRKTPSDLLFLGHRLPSIFQNATENHWKFPIDFENATAVFNSVYGATKEKDSNMNPVGVNFFPAYIAPNTFMYHSRDDPRIPELYEWLAMDYEFSYSFASFGRGIPRRHTDGPGKPGSPERPSPGLPGGRALRKDPPKISSPEALKHNINLEKQFPEKKQSYLFTFKNKHPLDKLIFLDGDSAAKSTTGEMDQQMILSQQEDVDGYVNEREAADRICKWGSAFGLQGIVRLEVGFELILCDFHRDLELISNVTLYNTTNLAGFPCEIPEPKSGLEKSRSRLMDGWQSMSRFEWMRSGADVNDGDERILVDFSNMVTPLNKTWIDPDPYQRRINTIPQDLKNSILIELESTISKGVNPFHRTNWPQIIGHIVNKFSPMLLNLNNTLAIFESSPDSDLALALKRASESISTSTFNFIRRYSDEDITDDNNRSFMALRFAVEDYVHNTFEIQTQLDRLIYSSVYKVTKEIIDAIFRLHAVSIAILPDFYVVPTVNNYTEHKEAILRENRSLQALLKSLRWSAFTRCSRKCGWNEVCAVPGWGPGPMGWMFGNEKYLHYELGSYRVNKELQCVSIKDL
ncbi:hypothetical protein METBIDRAFT_33572 [Metschnikowia bicuspidata var. bicuspidata NRRL YB-4993]|uniref:Uncharacterized protein n=1 Tax=Metschnikowia bicuspidata var. bicuspidata NRRL YB-4993 TaxID=869754 RepID=A0A1A0H665_9ASCO|nr:hypothetical protein METBIDRAFT_33572 [Metschnikowia bicuspidata var. bicuspidata NRRL YB-4993]OBA19408.1 hypothetical protein METBIDRAFT_33572 [Metschnikowia bicuspidata var. bicuspidata NRRL YB-4993]